MQAPTVERLWIRIAQYLSYVLPYDEFVPSRATKLELAGLWYQHGKNALDAVPDKLRNDPAYIELGTLRSAWKNIEKGFIILEEMA